MEQYLPRWQPVCHTALHIASLYQGCVQGVILTYFAAIEPFVSASDNFLQYADDTSSESCLKALSDLETYIVEDGPFDGVMAFSQGAGLAASLLIHQMQKDAHKAHLYPVFSCAVFFSGGAPKDPRAERSAESTRLMWWVDDGEVIEIPTVHVWGRNDTLYPTFGPVLSKLCKASEREELVHDGGHDIPGPKDPVTVEKIARLIKRTIERAETAP